MVGVFEIWLVVAFLGFTLAVPLGPVNTEMIKQVLNKQISEKVAWFSAILTGIGAMTGDFIVAFSALTVGGEILTVFFTDPVIRFLLFSFNILILGYLGLSALFSKQYKFEQPSNENDLLPKQNNNQTRLFGKQYITGLSLVVSSPWSYLWWVSAGTLILFSDFNAPDLISRLFIVVMFLTGILSWIIIFTTTLAIVGRLPDPRVFYWITKGTALILLLFAGAMVVEAWNAFTEIITISANIHY